jgi:hypothetical protein
MKKIGYRQKSNTILPVIIALCIPVLLYLQTLSFGFTYFDDNKIIINNITFLSDFKNALQAFQTDAFIKETGYFYRPLQTLSYMTDINLSGGNNTWMYHLSNVLLLGLIACLLYLLLRRFLIPSKLALLSVLVYCAHPLFVSSIAWIPARGDLLLAFFSLVSFLFFIDYLQKKKIRYLFLHWSAFTIALFCKETAAVLPVLFITYYFAFSYEKRFETKYLFNIVLYFISGIFWFWLRSNAIEGFSNRDEVMGLFGENNKIGLIPILSNIRTIPESLAKFFIPFDIAPIPGFSLMKTLIGSGIIVIIIILFFKNKERSKKEKIFCLSWFLLLLFPTMLFKHEAIDYLDHRFFLPLIGILLFVLFVFPKKWFEKGENIISWSMLAIFLFLSYLTFINSRSYSDTMTFYNSAISKNSNSVIAYNNRGAAYSRQGLLDKAINDYTKAIVLKPDYATAYNSRGNAYLNQKLYDLAIADYTKVIELKVGDANTYNNRGAAYIHKGLYDKACPDFKKAVELGSRGAKENINRFCVKQITD